MKSPLDLSLIWGRAAKALKFLNWVSYLWLEGAWLRCSNPYSFSDQSIESSPSEEIIRSYFRCHPQPVVPTASQPLQHWLCGFPSYLHLLEIHLKGINFFTWFLKKQIYIVPWSFCTRVTLQFPWYLHASACQHHKRLEESISSTVPSTQHNH